MQTFLFTFCRITMNPTGIFSDNKKDIFRNPERFLIQYRELFLSANECQIIGLISHLKFSISILKTLLQQRRQRRNVAPYMDTLDFTGTSFKIDFDCKLIGIIKINIQGFIYHTYDSLDGYMMEQ